jgi:beta-lactam-binding protein with PASTA domain
MRVLIFVAALIAALVGIVIRLFNPNAMRTPQVWSYRSTPDTHRLRK